ncbi:DUF11 domain-containing protein [bacterium]|nr:DUF11 domain-containing protein [bacterium]
MSKKFLILVLLAFLMPFAAGAKAIGPNVSVYRDKELKWEDGAYGYHVMFKSLLENKETNNKEKDEFGNVINPQGDTCKDSSTYTLDMSHIPPDAIIEDAYLVWTSAVPVAKKNDPTDNEVSFSFVSDDGTIQHSDTIKGKKAYKVADAGVVSFEFDAYKDTDDPNKSWFTYRVNVRDFFQKIQEKGRAGAKEGASFYDGYSLIGNYTLSGLECANDEVYKGSTEMVADWSVILIYSSVKISPKKIYLYDGFQAYFHTLSEIKVTGFEFPIDPEIRITLASHEGDPGLFELEPESGILVPEGIQVQGDLPDWLLLSNECNPPAYGSNGFINLDYTEIFNSISSVYGWDETNPTCIGGIPPVFEFDKIEYGMDVDTFIMDSYTDGSYAAHFHKGGQEIKLRVGANQDQVITNYMIVSVDTKAPQFDIPGQPEKVACTPASDRFDSTALEGKWCQNGLEHTFALRIQNWGTDSTNAVTVQDTIPAGMEYVPGSTEYATSFKVENGKKIATRWMPIPDNGGFPLETGFKVTDSLNFCPDGSDYLACEDMVMVRFRAKVKGETPKNHVIENTATYKSAGVNDYKTNLGIPVKLRMISSGCVNSQDAVDLSDCGGVGAAACTKNEDCGEGFICDAASGACVEDPSMVKCNNSEITASIGKNSPNSKVIFISNPQTDLVIGQLELAGSGENCYMNLESLNLKFSIKDNNISISNIKMYKDNNSNGVVDAEDTLLATAEAVADSGYASFSPSKPENILWDNKKNNILFTVDASYTEGAVIQNSATFTALVESDGGVSLSGSPAIKGLPVDFSTFQFEPAEGFIVTKGPHDPEVPAKSEMNRFQDVLQLRITAKGADETIKKMTIKVPKSNMVSFGNGINRLAVYEDTDNDGKGDTELVSTTSFDGTQKHQFTLNFDVPKDTDKYLTIKAEPSLGDGQIFQIQVSAISVNSLDVLGLPVDSRPYEYSCDPNLEDCGGDGGCSIVAAEETDNTALFAVVAALTLFLSAIAFRMRKN